MSGAGASQGQICRIWHGCTTQANADAYEAYLRDELFRRLARELGAEGYRGFHILKSPLGNEVEFVTLVWFSSLDVMKAFAGEDYQQPYVSETAQKLLAHHNNYCTHFELSETSWELPAA